jgi:hypothetical protein
LASSDVCTSVCIGFCFGVCYNFAFASASASGAGFIAGLTLASGIELALVSSDDFARRLQSAAGISVCFGAASASNFDFRISVCLLFCVRQFSFGDLLQVWRHRLWLVSSDDFARAICISFCFRVSKFNWLSHQRLKRICNFALASASKLWRQHQL